MEKYVVYLVKYSGDKLPKFYIGSTSESKIKNGYLGSIRSKKWKEIFKYEVKNNIDLFKVEILSTHNTRKDALLAEYNIQKEKDVVKSNIFFNESFANINGYFGRDVSGYANPMCGRNNEVIAINKITNRKVRVSKEEFLKNDDLTGHTFGIVYAIEIISGKKVNIIKSEFEKNRDKYSHPNDGRKHDDNLKLKLSKMRKGLTTVKDWDGNVHRVHMNDERLKNGVFGGISSKRWLLTDLDGNIYKVFNLLKFFKDNNLQRANPENIINGIITFKWKLKKNKHISTNGWSIVCLDNE